MTEFRRISKIAFTTNSGLGVFPAFSTSDRNEFIYRTASGIVWNSELKCFMASEPGHWKPVQLFSHILNEVKNELGLALVVDGNSEFEFSDEAVLDDILNAAFRYNLSVLPKYDLIYVREDGTAREVTLSERIYLQIKYFGGDGDRPYIKARYSESSPSGRISGFCFRKSVPKTVIIEMPDGNANEQGFRNEVIRAKNMGYEVDFTGIEYVKKALFA